MDTDTLWLDDPQSWWKLFEDMDKNDDAAFGLAENTSSGISWYNNQHGETSNLATAAR